MDEFGVLMDNYTIGSTTTTLANLKLKHQNEKSSSFLDSSSLPVEELDDIFKSPVHVTDKTVQAQKNLLDDNVDDFTQFGPVDLNCNLDDWLGISEKQSDDDDDDVGPVHDDVFRIFEASTSTVELEEKVFEFEDWIKKFENQSERNTPFLNVDDVQHHLNVDDEQQKHENSPNSIDQRSTETMDYDIKHWAAGKEGNLRALLSSLHQVLWPECGWHPVSLADLITSDAVNKVYKKATLYVHPDKVQQKDLQQKYIAEKVFHLLQDARNKFRAEELQ